MASRMSLEDWLDDLCARFVINLPEEDLSSVERICFHVEEAQWFYEDFVRPLNPSLPSMSLRSFCLRIFEHCPLLSSFSRENHLKAFEGFIAYKQRIPVRGAILLNEAMDSTVLVKGWKKGANWSFPRGKINMDEDDLDCAIREVYEETGLDVRAAGLVPSHENVKYIELSLREQDVRLYVFRNVPMDTNFEPKTRKEISKIEWYPLSELPAFRKKNMQQQSQQQQQQQPQTVGPNKFYMVAPFLVPLKKWVVEQKKRDARLTASLLAADNAIPEETQDELGQYYTDTAYETAYETDAPAQYHYQQKHPNPNPEQLETASRELQRLLKIQPRSAATEQPLEQQQQQQQASQAYTSEALPDSTPPAHGSSGAGGALLALLQSKPAAPPTATTHASTYPAQTPQIAVSNVAPQELQATPQPRSSSQKTESPALQKVAPSQHRSNLLDMFKSGAPPAQSQGPTAQGPTSPQRHVSQGINSKPDVDHSTSSSAPLLSLLKGNTQRSPSCQKTAVATDGTQCQAQTADVLTPRTNPATITATAAVHTQADSLTPTQMTHMSSPPVARSLPVPSIRAKSGPSQEQKQTLLSLFGSTAPSSAGAVPSAAGPKTPHQTYAPVHGSAPRSPYSQPASSQQASEQASSLSYQLLPQTQPQTQSQTQPQTQPPTQMQMQTQPSQTNRPPSRQPQKPDASQPLSLLSLFGQQPPRTGSSLSAYGQQATLPVYGRQTTPSTLGQPAHGQPVNKSNPLNDNQKSLLQQFLPTGTTPHTKTTPHTQHTPHASEQQPLQHAPQYTSQNNQNAQYGQTQPQHGQTQSQYSPYGPSQVGPSQVGQSQVGPSQYSQGETQSYSPKPSPSQGPSVTAVVGSAAADLLSRLKISAHASPGAAAAVTVTPSHAAGVTASGPVHATAEPTLAMGHGPVVGGGPAVAHHPPALGSSRAGSTSGASVTATAAALAMASSIPRAETPISPEHRDFLLGYLRSATSQI